MQVLVMSFAVSQAYQEIGSLVHYIYFYPENFSPLSSLSGNLVQMPLVIFYLILLPEANKKVWRTTHIRIIYLFIIYYLFILNNLFFFFPFSVFKHQFY